MASPNIIDTSVFGIEVESPEGTYVAPSGTGSYFQPDEDGFDLSPNREFLERNVMNASIGPTTPKRGMRQVSGSLTCEMKASGTEGGEVDYGALLKGALGASRAVTSANTTKSTGNTASVLQIEDADIGDYSLYDIVVIKQGGLHTPVVITAIDSTGGAANITVSPAKASGSWANSVVVSKTQMYYTANSGHPALSLSYYWANEIRQSAYGAKVTSMSLDNFTVGQMPKWTFAFEGLGYDEINGAAPHTPVYDTGIPPVALQACLYKDGVALPINTFGLTVENTLSYQTSTCSANGRIASRVSERRVTGSINPYMDDTTFAFFTHMEDGDTFSLLISAYNPSGTAGEMNFGSCVGIYLPNCMVNSYKKGNLEGLLTDEVTFLASRGTAGATEEMYLGLI